jgi:uracil-DNA glycosylase
VDARILMLLEAPGPKAVKTGYISRRNPDPSARNMLALLAEAGIEDCDVLLWNIVPWYVGNGQRIRPVRVADIRQAGPWTEELVALLPRLETVVLVGKKAQRAAGWFPDYRVLRTWHPSNLVFNCWPKRRAEVADAFRQACSSA